MDKDTLKSLKVSELKTLLKDLGASVTGNKNVLVERIFVWREKGLDRKLVKPIEVEVEHVTFPDNFQPIEQCDVKPFKKFSLINIDRWFDLRQATSSRNRGRDLFLAKFVKYCSASCAETTIFLRCICAAETTKNKEYKVQVAVQCCGSIKHGSCSCTAGEGSSAACKHIAALLYCFEHYLGSNTLHQLVSKTSQLQTWHHPRPGRGVKPKTTQELSLHSKACIGPIGLPMRFSPTTDDAANIAINFKANCLFIKCARRPALSDLVNDHYYDSGNELIALQSINDVTDKEREMIERKTRKQSNSTLWWKARRTRITGSHIHQVVSTVRNGRMSKVPALSILMPKPFKTAATEWGKKNEIVAIEEYERITGTKVSPSGLHVHPQTCYIASSPDGITDDETAVEVKCPYSLRDEKPTAATYLCRDNNGMYSLKRNSTYFYQVQSHMYCMGLNKCDFVVWTRQGVFIELIKFDATFFVSVLEDINTYYEKVFCIEAIKVLDSIVE